MGTTDGTVQGRGPRRVGGVGVAPDDLSVYRARRELAHVRVVWSTTRQYETYVSAADWERIGGAEGPVNDVVAAFLADLEDESNPQVTELGVDLVVRGQ